MTDQIRLLEELAANAWPPVVHQMLDGWLLRYASGVSRRANSTFPLAAGTVPLEDRIREVEAFYRRRGLPPRFHLSPAASPPDLDSILADRGYRFDCRTGVQSASLSLVQQRLAGSSLKVTLAEAPDPEWLSVYNTTHSDDAAALSVRLEIMSRTGPPSVFARVILDGRAIAVGQGVAERRHLGVFSMSTHPNYRRRGAATAILRALCEWGSDQGAAHTYLQVMDESAEALSLYGKLGFETVYHYHYREGTR